MSSSESLDAGSEATKAPDTIIKPLENGSPEAEPIAEPLATNEQEEKSAQTEITSNSVNETAQDTTSSTADVLEESHKKRSREDDEENDREEEDYDDDEEEDEDDDEDDEARNKRKRQERNRFLDIEAEVSDDEDEDEDEEDSELVREGFITHGVDEEEGDEGTAEFRQDDRLHRQLDQNLNKSSEEDAQRLARELRERYGRSSSKQYRAAAQDGYVPQRFLLPSVDTATVWGVRCRPGKEKELVRKLLKKKFNLDRAMGAKKLKILSIFQRDNYTGRIYMEAPKQSVVEKFCTGVPDIFITQKLLIPVQELPLLLKPGKADGVTLEEGTYVRIKRGIYKGDLAMIDQISENNLDVLLKIVPRLDYGKFDEVDPITQQKKSRRPTFAHRAPPQLFNPTMALRLDQANLFKSDDRHFKYRNEDYVDGYLYKSYKVQHVDAKDIEPTVEELARFGSKDGAVDLTTISQTIKKSQAANVSFQSGDRVEILNGEQRGSRGIVTKTSATIATVNLPDFPLKPLEFPIASLRKIFQPGDHVTVIRGEHTGDAGLVLLVKQGQVTFMSNQTREEVTITANNLTKSLDSTPTSSEFALHDIVELSAKNVGCIIQAGHDIFKIIDETGKVSTITKGSILNKINTARLKITTVDGNGNEVKIGDTVVERVGARREGQVLYIQTQQIFVVSKKIMENAGVFVVDPANVETVSSRDNVLGNKLDLSRMNPDITTKVGNSAPGSFQAPQPQFGRDVALGKTVRVRTAGYKGQLGIVRDVNGEKATIELHSKNKHITIDKRKLMYYNKEGGEGITYEELVNRRGRVPQSRMGPSYVSAPRHMASGGFMPERPGLTGGMTPGWNGSFDGGKTPAANSHGQPVPGGGGLSTWGGTSTWGGQGAGGGASAWGGAGAGATSTWGGAGSGATSTWGGASAWAGKGNNGGSSTWANQNAGSSSTWGGNNGGTSTWGGASTWGNKSSWGGASTWAQNNNSNK